MTQSSTLYVGLAVHNDSIAVAYVAKDHGAEVGYLGTMGTRHWDLDQLSRNRQSKANQLIFIDRRSRAMWLLALSRSA
jgi:hypothetical protein